MALTLTSGITADADEFVVTGTVPANVGPGFRFRIDDELLRLQGFGAHTEIVGAYARQWAGKDPQRWLVERGVEHSTPASHAQGADVLAANDAYVSSDNLTPPSPFTGGGEGGSGLPAGGDVGDVVTNTAPGEGEWAAPEAGGSGVLPDPGNVWEAETVVADEYRLASGPRVFSALGGGTTGTELPDFDSPLAANGTVPDGDFSWRFIGFIGEVPFASLSQTLPVIAIPQSGPMTDDLDANGNAFTGFSTLEPESPPEVPASPTEQDIVDALVTLGLVTQAGGG